MTFSCSLTLGLLGLPHPSLGGMVAAVSSRISREALHQRFTASAAAFLRHCLHTVLRHKLQTVPIRTKLLQPFARVSLVDSSSWDVSEELGAVLPGSGGNASTANCKLQTVYDYKQGELTFLATLPALCRIIATRTICRPWSTRPTCRSSIRAILSSRPSTPSWRKGPSF